MSATSQRHMVGHDSVSSKDQPENRQALSSWDTTPNLSNHAVSHALHGGSPLGPDVRAEMEARFGEDFSRVRTYNDSTAHRNTAQLHAKAYTVGENITFSANRYAPHSSEGKRLLAHELAHVVQQRRGGPQHSSIGRQGVLETDAGQAAEVAVNGSGPVTVAGSSAPGVACDLEDYWKRAKASMPEGAQKWVDEKETAAKAYVGEKKEQAEAWVGGKQAEAAELYDTASAYVGEKKETLDTWVDEKKASVKELPTKLQAKYEGAKAALHQAAYDFDVNAAEKFADVTAPGPELIANASTWLAKKTADMPQLGPKMATLDKTVQSVTGDIKQGNREFWREALLGDGIQKGLDKAMGKYDSAVKTAAKAYEDSGINPFSFSPLAPVGMLPDEYGGKWMRQGQSGVGLALWEMGKGLVNVANHPVVTARGLGNLPRTYGPLDSVRESGNAIAFLDDVITGKKNFRQASEDLSKKNEFSPSRDWEASKALWKGLTHNYVEDIDQGRYGRIPGRLLVDIGSFFIPGGASTKATKGAEIANALSKGAKGLEVAGEVGKASEVAKGLDVAGDLGKGAETTKGLGEAGDLAKTAPAAGEGKGLSTLSDTPSLFKDLEGKFKELFGSDVKPANDNMLGDIPKTPESPMPKVPETPAQVIDLPKDMPRPAEPYKFKPGYEPVSDIGKAKPKPPEPPTAAPQVQEVPQAEGLVDAVAKETQVPLKKASGMRDPVPAGGVAESSTAMASPKGPKVSGTKPSPIKSAPKSSPATSVSSGGKGRSKGTTGKPTRRETPSNGAEGPKAQNEAPKSKPTEKPRTPDDEFADFKKMLAEEGFTGPVTSDQLLQLYRHGSRATVVKYLKEYLLKQVAADGVMTVGDFSRKVKSGVALEKQVADFVKDLEGAHSTPQAFGKKLPKDVQEALPGGKYNPDDALVVFTEDSKNMPTHTAMDQPWKDFFNNVRKGGAKEATAQEVFDAVADGIRKTPGISDSEKASRIARLSDEMFTELGLVPGVKYPVPRIYNWWEILGFKSK